VDTCPQVPVGVGAAGAAPKELLQPATASARRRTAIDITPTWRPLRRIVPDVRYVIISGLLCEKALC
jgi:hypothetical protein